MSSINPKKRKDSGSESMEPNHSFIRNMTSRMSDLLPVNITKWFNNPTSSSSNGSAPTADSDSSTEDSVIESSVIVQPPAKKMRYSNTPIVFNHEPKNVSGTTEPSTSFNLQTPASLSVFQKEAHLNPTPIISSSQETRNQSGKDNTKFKSHHTVSQIGSSVAKKRKSVSFSDTPKNASDRFSSHSDKNPNQPCFETSLLRSPFYHGQTTYGGASGSYYLNEPNVKQRKVAIVNEAEKTNNTISTSAQRVMELLDQYCSPLTEAKRMPQYTRSYSTNRLVNTPSTSQNRMNSHKVQDLLVPNVASFLRLKQRNRLMETTSTARQIMASQSSTSDNPVNVTYNKKQDELPSKFISKVTSRLTRPKRGERDYENDTITPVVLPTGTLQIDSNNLPKFSFDQTPHHQTTSKTSTVKSDLEGTNTIPVDVPATDSTQRYKFSIPIRISLDLPNKTNDISDEKSTTSLSCDAISAKQICSKKSKEWKCSDCWVSNVSEVDKCVCCGGKRPFAGPLPSSECTPCKFCNCLPDKGKCATCQNTQINSIPKSTDISKWKCNDCLIHNDENANKCVCCGANKPETSGNITDWKCTNCWIINKSDVQNCEACGVKKRFSMSQPISTSSTAVTIGFKFEKPSTDNSNKSLSGANSCNNYSNTIMPIKAQPSTEWRCGDCWVMNKSEADKCVACGSSKLRDNEPSPKKIVKSDLSSFVKAQSNKWECSSCLVRNDENKLHCTCCDAQKPGTVSEAAQKMFKFGSTQNTFKFGINSVQSEPEKVNNTEEKTVISETNNNVLPKATGFSFGLPETKDTTVSPFKGLETKDLPKANFSFGIPAKPVTSTTNSTSTLSLLAPKEATKENNDDKEQEVPKMPELKEVPKTSLVISPISTSSLICESKTSNTRVKPPSYFTAAEKKDTQSTQIVPSATTASESQATFTFSSGTSMKIHNNLFGTATTSALFTPVATTVTTATITSLPNTKTTTDVTPFQKTETTTATATTAPIFSFGSNAASTSAQNEKPLFNFSFGSNNKAETLFKPSFGDTSNSSNFSLGTGIVTTTAASAIPTVNSTLSTNNMFLASTQKENLWSSHANNTAASSNVLSGAMTNTSQKVSAFSFGAPSTTPAFGANATPAFGNSSVTNATPAFGCSVATNATPAFGTNAVTNTAPIFLNSSATNTSSAFGAIVTSTATPAFGSSAAATFGSPATNSTPAFGSAVASGAPAFGSATFGTSAQPAKPPPAFGASVPSSLFGVSNQNCNNRSTLFAAPVINNSVTPLFGNTENNPSNPAPASGIGMFATPSATPAFGSPSTSFEPPMPPGFNFGSPSSPASGMFGFGQSPQTSIYSFGGVGGNGSVQFNMGSGPVSGTHAMPVTRKIRKARRSTTPR